MLTPERMLRFIIESIFVLLGLMLIWLGLRGPIHGRTVDRHSVAWVVLSVALILWGLRALPKQSQWWARWQNWTRGLSLALLGALMLTIKWAPFLWVGPMLAVGGAILVLRGVIVCSLVFRPQ
jgi:EamA domain-containing membrane protein RarD